VNDIEVIIQQWPQSKSASITAYSTPLRCHCRSHTPHLQLLTNQQ